MDNVKARTGPLVHALAEGVKEDLEDIGRDFIALRNKIDALGESARAINGLSGSCAGWSDTLKTLHGAVVKEQNEIPSKLLGKPIRVIQAHSNPDHEGSR